MSIRMLIDASHQEETRVAIVDGNRVEDFDYESSAKKQLKGSIYLAKVTRVEPSLQAAFVDYGGNRHGFLAFSEIHPDYYQIPVADREALIAAEAEANADLLEEVVTEEEEKPKRRRRRPNKKKEDTADASKDETSSEEASPVSSGDDNEQGTSSVTSSETDEVTPETDPEKPTDKPKRRPRKTKAEATKSDDVIVEEPSNEFTEDDVLPSKEVSSAAEEAPETAVENDADNEENATNGTSDEEDEEEKLRIKMAKRLRYKYKIQEVIKKNQIILIQVVKEERGNKGAALTTYLSLPGRYCVLMPNTLHGGGVSRKIANVKDRKKLKSILTSLDMPKGHACIIRTAGSDRTKPEISRDYDYLKRMWEAIRELTLKSIAPAQIYEEGNLIKRSIRDLYTKDVSEILVEGEDGYKTAKNFMGMLMPSHSKKIHHYEDSIPLFQKYQVEAHLDSMYSPTAQLKSGGYIVINPTEALVSIDVNSGRATKEHNIEGTALKTNLEAAEEIARQLKLRDMAGLVVIDFIDMEENRNNRAVERKMKECLKSDRARIQVGRISSFGLMEMSRQRIRVGVLESSTTACPHCEGSGLLRSVESQSLHILRIVEEEGIRAKNSRFTVYLPSRVAIYILNNKRNSLIDLEARYDFNVTIAIDDDLTASAHRMDKSGKPSKTSQQRKDSLRLGRDVNTLIDVTEEDVSPNEVVNENVNVAKNTTERPKRRRRRRGQQNRQNTNSTESTEQTEKSEVSVVEADTQATDINDRPKRKRRPRRRKPYNQDNKPTENGTNEAQTTTDETKSESPSVEAVSTNNEKEKQENNTKRPRNPRVKTADKEQNTEANTGNVVPNDSTADEKPKRTRKPRVSKTQDDAETTEVSAEKPKRAPRKRAPKKDEVVNSAPPVAETVQVKEPVKEEKAKPKKKGWWSRS